MVKEVDDKAGFFRYNLPNLLAKEEQNVHVHVHVHFISICIRTTIRITDKRLFLYPTEIPEAAESVIKHCVKMS